MKQRKLAIILLMIISGIALALTACNSQPPVVNAPSSSAPATGAFDHSAFDKILAAYLSEQGWVDYAGLQQQRAPLDAYTATLATARPQEFPNEAERLAFWINAYNALTLADVLDTVYQKHGSVQAVKGFFDGRKHRVAGEELTLNEIEKRGRDLKDPRIHFAVNCASTSCPKLQRFAFTSSQLEEQLNRITREFMADQSRGMKTDEPRNQIFLSSIFKWYAGDFTMSSSVLARVKAEVSGGEILEYVKKYAPAEAVRFIAENNPSVKYLDYDWSLNAQETHR